MSRLTAEQLNASAEHDFDFAEEEVEVPQLGGSILLRELDVKRRSRLLKGLTDENGNVKDVEEMQIRLFAASCIDPPIGEKEVRRFLPKWPATVADAVFKAINKLGGPEGEKEEVSAAEAEFHETGE